MQEVNSLYEEASKALKYDFKHKSQLERLSDILKDEPLSAIYDPDEDDCYFEKVEEPVKIKRVIKFSIDDVEYVEHDSRFGPLWETDIEKG